MSLGPDLKHPIPRQRRGRGLLWFVLGGVAATLLILFVPSIHRELKQTEKKTMRRALALQKTITRPPAATTHSTLRQAPHFDFYRLLTRSSQILTAGESREIQKTPATKQVAVPGAYILQVASFQSRRDARALKAQLALWGIEAKVQSVTVRNESWNRVRIGPVSNLTRLNRLRNRLLEHKLKPMLVRIGN